MKIAKTTPLRNASAFSFTSEGKNEGKKVEFDNDLTIGTDKRNLFDIC